MLTFMSVISSKVTYTNNPFPQFVDVWIKTTEEDLTRAEAVRGVPKKVQKPLEKLEVGHILFQPPSPPPIHPVSSCPPH